MELIEAVHRFFQGVIWERCQAQFRGYVLDKTPAARKESMAAVLVRILEAGLEDAMAVLLLSDSHRRRLNYKRSGASLRDFPRGAERTPAPGG